MRYNITSQSTKDGPMIARAKLPPFRELSHEEEIECARMAQTVLERQLEETERLIESLARQTETSGQLEEKKNLRTTLQRRIASCIRIQSDPKDP